MFRKSERPQGDPARGRSAREGRTARKGGTAREDAAARGRGGTPAGGASGSGQDRRLLEPRRRDRDRRRRLGRRSPLNRHGLARRWRRPLVRADDARDSVAESLAGVRRSRQPGRAFAKAQDHLAQTHASVQMALDRCQDIALAAQQLEQMLGSLPKDRSEDRGRLSARLDEAEARLDQHVAAMESAAIAARELVLQSTLTSRDENAVLDIGARLRGVSEMLDADPRG